jgi:hypothetical protein
LSHVATRIEGVGVKADPIGVKPYELFEVIVQRIVAPTLSCQPSASR